MPAQVDTEIPSRALRATFIFPVHGTLTCLYAIAKLDRVPVLVLYKYRRDANKQNDHTLVLVEEHFPSTCALLMVCYKGPILREGRGWLTGVLGVGDDE